MYSSEQQQTRIIDALVIRLRMHLAEHRHICSSRRELYEYAGEVLNMKGECARIILSRHKKIRNMSYEQCIRALRSASPVMYDVAMIDEIKNQNLEYRLSREL